MATPNHCSNMPNTGVMSFWEENKKKGFCVLHANEINMSAIFKALNGPLSGFVVKSKSTGPTGGLPLVEGLTSK